MTGYEAWIGRTQTQTQIAERWPVMGLCALLDKDSVPDIGEPIPPTAHWLYFAPTVRQSRIGSDGHPERGGFLPPIPQPRRMWAGSDIVYSGAIRIGDAVTKTARITDIASKEGKTGPLIFVTVENRYEVGGRDVLLEEQTLVYRDHPDPHEAPPPSKPAPSEPAWSRRVDPDPVLLFRYSAVTFNAHRIHYDQAYATLEEGYPGIIVHGQLTATMLLDQVTAEHPDLAVKAFSFRAMRPLFSGQPFYVEGGPADADSIKLWARDAAGVLSLTANLKV